jgi:hypothetical protein
MRRFAFAATALIGCTPLTTSHAQQADSDRVVVDVDACVDLATREQQEACFQERIDEVLQQREAASNASVTEPTTEAAVLPEPSRASRREEQRAAREAERRQREAAALAEAATEAAAVAAEAAAAVQNPDYVPGEIFAKITALEQMEPDAYMITLDNGQIWRQNQPKRYPLKVGAEVWLRPSRWGPSYRLTDRSVGNFIQVRRVE